MNKELEFELSRIVRRMTMIMMTHPSENGDLFSVSVERLVTDALLVVAGDCVLVAACPTTF